MKLLKKIMAGALSLAVICGAMFAFVGCNEVKGNTYAYETLTFTIVTEFEDDEKIGTDEAVVKSTRTLSAREFYLYEKEGKTLEELATATTEATDKEILEWCENYITAVALVNMDMEMSMFSVFKKGEFTFGGKTLEIVYNENESETTGDYMRTEMEAEYSVKDGKIEVVMTEVEEGSPMTSSTIINFNVAGEKVEKKYNLVSEASEYVKGELASFTMVLNEVK